MTDGPHFEDEGFFEHDMTVNEDEVPEGQVSAGHAGDGTWWWYTGTAWTQMIELLDERNVCTMCGVEVHDGWTLQHGDWHSKLMSSITLRR